MAASTAPLAITNALASDRQGFFCAEVQVNPNADEEMILSMGWRVIWSHYWQTLPGITDKVLKFKVICARGKHVILARAYSKEQAFRLAADMVEQLDELGL